MQQTAVFNVSAKTARLIGRENINDADGALTELVKNSYDADASIVIIVLDIPFPLTPIKLDTKLINQYLSEDEKKIVLNYYEKQRIYYHLKDDITSNDEELLFSIFNKKNKIIIIDNGIGMDESVLTTKWMNIGTNDKEINKISKKGRVKTGAKGIGRFALDKLSLVSTLYTQKKYGKTYEWKMNWNLFDSAEMLNEVNATYENINLSFDKVISKILEGYVIDECILDDYDWSSGSALVLTPLRERWNNRLFTKINRNFSTINPFGSIDKFDMYSYNVHNKEFDFKKIDESITRDNYDYFVSADFDGCNNVIIKLNRNEIDSTIKTVHFAINNNEDIRTFNTKDFWSRITLKDTIYDKDKVSDCIEITMKVSEIFSDKNEFLDYETDIKKIGAFHFEFYFLKSQNGEFEIMKKVKSRARKELLTKYKGIKIYRDKFKVRPYGEEDNSLYDWLNLSDRAQKSPAGVSDKTGSWRVLPYQLIGSVQISREENPYLDDQANRESISGSVFEAFKQILINIIRLFEFDRQYIPREFGKWRKEIKKKNITVIPPDDLNKELKDKNKEQQEEYIKEKGLTPSDIVDSLKEAVETKNDSTKENQLFRAFSASGMIANTFSHELHLINTDIKTMPQILQHTVAEILKDSGYIPKKIYDPFPLIERLDASHKLLDSWIEIIMNTIRNGSAENGEINLIEEINIILDLWVPLLEQKKIHLNPLIADLKKICTTLNKGDLYLIINNFILNSAHFLQSFDTEKRIIQMKIYLENTDIVLYMFNNGPVLDEKYKNNPMATTLPGETTKEVNGKKSTGLGMWLMDEACTKNGGKLKVLDLDEGFAVKVYLPYKE